MGGRTILIVDDEDDIREITKLALEIVGGWHVLDADRGARALDLAEEHRPDVVLLDVMMPEMDGPSTCRLLRERESTRHIPVILLTAKVSATEDDRWEDLGLAGVISKPFDPTSLSNEIDRLLVERST